MKLVFSEDSIPTIEDEADFGSIAAAKEEDHMASAEEEADSGLTANGFEASDGLKAF